MVLNVVSTILYSYTLISLLIFSQHLATPKQTVVLVTF